MYAILAALWWMVGCFSILYYHLDTEKYIDGEGIAFAILLGFFGLFTALPIGFIYLLKWWKEANDD